MYQRKCGRRLRDITPLLAEEEARNVINLKPLLLGDSRESLYLVDFAADMLTKQEDKLNIVAREELLGGIIPVELLGVDFSGRPVLIKCTSNCTSEFLVECFALAGRCQDLSFPRLLVYPGLKKELFSCPRLIIVAASFTPEVCQALKILSCLDLTAYRLTMPSEEKELSFEQWDFNRGDFFPPDQLLMLPRKKAAKPKDNGRRQNLLSLELEMELMDFHPLNSEEL